MESKITTIKLSKYTKERLDHLKVHHRETYEEIIEKILEILNICKINPAKAHHKLLALDHQIKENTKPSHSLHTSTTQTSQSRQIQHTHSNNTSNKTQQNQNKHIKERVRLRK